MDQVCIGAAIGFLLLASSTALAKNLKVENDTDQGVAAISLEGKDQVTGQKKPKKDYALGLASAPGRKKGKKHGDDDHTDKDIVVDDMTEENCIQDLTVTLDDGRAFVMRQLDLCNVEQIVVEDSPDAAIPATIAAQ